MHRFNDQCMEGRLVNKRKRRLAVIEHNPHDASGQLSGYLYQVLSALLLLLESRNPDSQLCIEKFDDVAFVEKDKPQIMIQIKQ